MSRILRTRVYIDGYNFYYGCLKGTHFKWLNLFSLFQDKILPSIMYSPGVDADPIKMTLSDTHAIKYFTAPILEKGAKSPDSVSSQAQYHNALKYACGEHVEIIRGKYSIYESNQKLVDVDDPSKWPRDCKSVQVWKFEEKQSDVRLALHIYDDAIRAVEEGIDQVVLVSNDTDLQPALEMLENRCPNIIRGVVIPTRKTDGALERTPNADLKKHAHWVRSGVVDDELRDAQLPYSVAGGRRRNAQKPISWYQRPSDVQKMLDDARPVMKTDGQTMKWAHAPCAYLDMARPIDLLEREETAQLVFKYIENYKRDFNID